MWELEAERYDPKPQNFDVQIERQETYLRTKRSDMIGGLVVPWMPWHRRIVFNTVISENGVRRLTNGQIFPLNSRGVPIPTRLQTASQI